MTGSSGMECQLQNLAETLPELQYRGAPMTYGLFKCFEVCSMWEFSTISVERRPSALLLARDDGR